MGTMNDRDYESLRAALRSALPPVGDAEPSRDLWPRMLERLDRRSARVAWFDWALVALLSVWLVLFPNALPALFYHL
jgi:hypothetical protein